MAPCFVAGPELVHRSTERTRNPVCLATLLVLWLLPLAWALPCFGAAPLLPAHCWHMSCSLLIPMALSCLQMRTLNSWSGTQISAFEPFLWALVYPAACRCLLDGLDGLLAPGIHQPPLPTAPHLPTTSQCHRRQPLGPMAAPVPTFVSAPRADCVLSKDGAGCLLSSPEVLAGHVPRRKGEQGREENELPCHRIGGPEDTSAAGSMISQPRASVTAETIASRERLSSGSKEISTAPLEGRGTECACDCTEFPWEDARLRTGSLAESQGSAGVLG